MDIDNRYNSYFDNRVLIMIFIVKVNLAIDNTNANVMKFITVYQLLHIYTFNSNQLFPETISFLNNDRLLMVSSNKGKIIHS